MTFAKYLNGHNF
jgi:hypothetical protein